MSKPFLIVSLPHSGTRFMARVLEDLGLKTAHEHRRWNEKGIEGRVSGLHWDLEENKKFSPLIHQVRHPLSWLNSHARKNGVHWNKGMYSIRHYKPLAPFIERDGIDPHVPDVKLLMVWLRGNQLIENYMNPEWRFRVEEIHGNTKSLRKLCEILKPPEVPIPGEDLRFFCEKSEGAGDAEPWHRRFYWPRHEKYQEQIDLVKAKAKEYGYQF